MTLSDLERAALTMLLDGDDANLAVLRAQLSLSRVVSRDPTGAGFFTRLGVPDDAVRVDDWSAVIHDVIGEIAGLDGGAHFNLFIENGKIDTLEGVSNGAPWPATITSFTLRYRDMPRQLEITTRTL